MIEILKADLPLNSINSITPFNKGWSDDQKFIVAAENGKYLLRVSDIKNKKRCLNHAALLVQAAENNTPTHHLEAHGECLNGSYYYLLLNWIEGNDAESVIVDLPEDEQYKFGLEAGRILAEIHSFKYAKGPADSWSDRYNRKIDKKLQMYSDSPLKYDKGDLLVDAVYTDRHLIENKTDVQHHGDFHIGNMLIDDNNQLHIIDFDRHDTGEAFEEFNRITWCASLSPAFASGRIDGYFNHNIPDNFFKLLRLYISVNMLSSLPWAISFGDKEIQTMRQSYRELLDWYDDFQLTVPKWYRSK